MLVLSPPKCKHNLFYSHVTLPFNLKKHKVAILLKLLSLHKRYSSIISVILYQNVTDSLHTLKALNKPLFVKKNDNNKKAKM